VLYATNFRSAWRGFWDGFAGVRGGIRDSLNNLTNYIYNKVGQLVTERKVVSGINRDRSFSYDGAGNLRSARDRNGRDRFFSYDNLYRNTAETWRTGSAVNQSFGFSYDAIGNLTAVTDSSSLGTNFQFTYDARNQLQLERQTAKVNHASFVLGRDYDAEGKLVRNSVNIGGTIVAGALNSGGTIAGGIKDLVNQYGYDSLDRLASVSQSGVAGGNAVAPKLASFSYNVASQMTDLRRYSDTAISAAALEVHSRYAYDGAARIFSITHAKSEIAAGQAWNGTSVLPASITPAQTIAAYHLSYDRDNRLTAFASYTDRFRTAYAYDTTDQLVGASSSTIAGLAAPSPAIANENYNLDLNGNRQTSTGVSQSASGTHNRLQTDGTFHYTFDNEGNTLTKTRIATGAVTQYVWDHRNRLIGVRERASATAVVNKETIYAYDVFDRKTLDRFDSDGIGGSNRDDLWVNDGQHPLLQYRDSDGVGTAQPYRLVNRYLHGLVVDQILADEQYASGTGPVLSGTVVSTTPGTTLWAVADHLGSVRDLVDNSGITRQHVVYDSFGNRISEVDRNAAGSIIANTHAAAVDTIFGYTGREWDKDTSLQYNRARWYDPPTGRWLSQDPIGFAAGDANLYRYAGNGPTTKTDPSGLFGVDFHFYTIYSLLRARGWEHQSSYEVAGWSQYVDNEPTTSPWDGLVHAAATRNFANQDLLRRTHFWGCGPDTPVSRNPDDLRGYTKIAIGSFLDAGDPYSDLGPFAGLLLHTFADTWPHESYTAWWNSKINRRTGSKRPNIGHGDTAEGGHYPDNPYNDVDKALEAAKTIYGLIPRGKGKHVPWHVLEGHLRNAFESPTLRGENYDYEQTTAQQVAAMQSTIKGLFGNDCEYNLNYFMRKRGKFLNAYYLWDHGLKIDGK